MRRLLIAAAAALIVLASAAPAEARPTRCNDLVDNDADGLVDLNDPQCVAANDDQEAARMPRSQAHAAARNWPPTKFASPISRIRSSCRRTSDTRFLCQVTFRQRRNLSYRGSLRIVWEREFNSSGALIIDNLDFRVRWFRANCGSLSPRFRVFAIRARNLECPELRKGIAEWYKDGVPFSSNCNLRPSPDRARCRLGKTAFSFKYVGGAG